jgi:hypothetical protein
VLHFAVRDKEFFSYFLFDNSEVDNMNPALETVRTLAQKYPDVITEGGLRWEIFNKEKNGLKESGAILKRGRKILIDTDRYFEWLFTQQVT